jgi:CDP-diacylglycerol--glycerol-3-phosphate 3-phosphatidyltransferase
METSAESGESTRKRSPRARSEAFWNAPNTITLGRIVAAPLLLLLPFFDGRTGSAVMGIGFLLVSLTDLLDGYLARAYGSVTQIGKLLDPLADKLLAMTALVLLVAMDGRIPLWSVPLVMLILARELAVTALRAMASAEGVVIAAGRLGKWKTGFQIAALTGLVIHYPWFGVPTHEVGMVLLVLATALTVWSGVEYFTDYLGSGEDGTA